MGIGHKNEARTSNFIFTIGTNRELTYSIQTANLPDVTLGNTSFFTGKKDLKLPSNKLSSPPLILTFLLSDDLVEWIEIYKWILICKNSETRILEHVKPCSLVSLDSQNQPIVTFSYTDVFPFEVTGLQYNINSGSSDIMNFTTMFSFNRLTVITKDGTEIDEGFTI